MIDIQKVNKWYGAFHVLTDCTTAVGKAAPDFNLPLSRGGRLSLGDALKGKKAVLLNFWFYD